MTQLDLLTNDRDLVSPFTTGMIDDDDDQYDGLTSNPLSPTLTPTLTPPPSQCPERSPSSLTNNSLDEPPNIKMPSDDELMEIY